MTSFNHKINKVNQLQFTFSTFSENLDSLCWDISKILHYLHYSLTDPRIWYAHSTNDALSIDTKVDDLDFDLRAKTAFLPSVHRVSQTHVFL